MTSMTSQQQDELVRTTVAHLKQLTVDRLKRVLKNEGLQVSGVKSELQRRLIACKLTSDIDSGLISADVYEIERRNNAEHLQRIQNAVRGYFPEYAMPQPANTYPSPYSNHTPASSASPSNFYSPTNRIHATNSLPSMPNYGSFTSRMSSSVGTSKMNHSQQTANLVYKKSPFYEIRRQLGASVELRPRETTRDTARMTIEIDADLAHQLQVNSQCRIYVFCAVSHYDSTWKPCDIAFPGHSELKINTTDIRANLKGLKNKPGSTRPVDITPFLGKKNAPRNLLELVYALTKDVCCPIYC